MIDAIIGQGKDGSYLHTKFLFEFAGLTAIPAGDASTEQSLAAVLLRALALDPNLDSNHDSNRVATDVPAGFGGTVPKANGACKAASARP